MEKEILDDIFSKINIKNDSLITLTINNEKKIISKNDFKIFNNKLNNKNTPPIPNNKNNNTNNNNDNNNKNNNTTPNSNNPYIFIDGSNYEIFKTNSLSLMFLRFCAIIIKPTINNKFKKEIIKKEFYSLVDVKKENDLFIYNTKFYGHSSNIPLIKKEELDVSSISSNIRRYLELEFCLEISNKFETPFLILDGSFDYKDEIEKNLIDNLSKSSKATLIAAISKTNSVICDNGLPLNYVLKKNSPKDNWFYHINNIMYFVSFNKKSNYNFRCDLLKGQIENLSELIQFSNDYSFPGYPYWLIEVHNSCKIDFNEGNLRKILFYKNAGNKIDELKLISSSSDAHSILDGTDLIK